MKTPQRSAAFDREGTPKWRYPQWRLGLGPVTALGRLQLLVGRQQRLMGRQRLQIGIDGEQPVEALFTTDGGRGRVHRFRPYIFTNAV